MEYMTIHEHNQAAVHSQLYQDGKVLGCLFDKENGVVGTGLYYFVADAVPQKDGTYEVYLMTMMGNLTGDVLVVAADTEFEVTECQLRYLPDYILARDGQHILGTMLLADAPFQVRAKYNLGRYEVAMHLNAQVILESQEINSLQIKMTIASDMMKRWKNANVTVITT